jgi:Domain of unknown function (DUF4760)
MSLELINTLATLTTVVIVAATAVAALTQLRHLRAGNQINAMLSIANQFDEREFRDALTLVHQNLDAAMDDPEFREFNVCVIRQQPTPAVVPEHNEVFHAARFIANTYEELGILVKNGIVDRDLFLDRYSWVISRAWNRMQRLIAWARAVSGKDAIWENFEYLVVLSEDYMAQHTSTYPSGVRRLKPHNPWPVPPAPVTA